MDGLERKIAEMQAVQDTLQHLADACCGDQRPDCPILTDLGNGPSQMPGVGRPRRQKRGQPEQRRSAD
ncbi:MerR family transcriptional regulator [Cypionkella psychrotolerans]|uniref:hypothetical protein n=1 Tax=Cypionkella psychrotolerans TaxID=1678131 RepID=UPI002E22E83A